jgi:D-alanine-D-alanine ligase
MKVAVLYGGSSAEREVSLRSGQAVFDAMLELGIDASLIDTAQTDTLSQLQAGNFDKVFPALHGRGGEDGVIQGVLEYLQLPYCGSGVFASALAMDKYKSKQVLAQAGIRVAKGLLLTTETNWQEAVEELGLPIMVKPAHEGSSIGMAKVNSADELKAAFLAACNYDDCVLAEQWLTGKEFTVAMVGKDVLPVIGLKPAESADFYDFDAKYVTGDTQYLLPSGLTSAQESELEAIAQASFTQLNCKGWGRVDIMAHNNQWYVLEANTLPGMTQTSLVPKAAAAYGWDFKMLVKKILDTA